MPRAVMVPLVAAGAFLAGWLSRPAGDASLDFPKSSRPTAAAISANAGPANNSGPKKAATPASAKTAWDEALALEEGSWRDLESARAWRCLAEKDPSLAWAESFRLTEGAELRATLTPDPATAGAWIALTPEEHRASASIEVSSLLMKLSPEAALQWTAGTADPDLRRDMELGIISQWAQAGPAAAAAWCDSATGSAECLPAVVSAWAATDLMAASAWLAARPVEAGRDSSTLSLIEPLLELEPASALAWAQTLTDPGVRRSAEDRIAGLMEPVPGTEPRQ